MAVAAILQVQEAEFTHQTVWKKVTTAQTVLAADNWH